MRLEALGVRSEPRRVREVVEQDNSILSVQDLKPARFWLGLETVTSHFLLKSRML